MIHPWPDHLSIGGWIRHTHSARTQSHTHHTPARLERFRISAVASRVRRGNPSIHGWLWDDCFLGLALRRPFASWPQIDSLSLLELAVSDMWFFGVPFPARLPHSVYGVDLGLLVGTLNKNDLGLKGGGAGHRFHNEGTEGEDGQLQRLNYLS